VDVYVLIVEYLVPLARVDELRPAHLEYLDRHYADGTFLVSGRQDPPAGGVILAADVDREALDAIIATDPYVTEEAARYRIVRFNAGQVAESVRDALASAGVDLSRVA
jgi:uncharacterized protein YciI